ncbi:MAG: RagB/SusD family nutrient uptake outer membrane protein [Chitinophagaceae bacterium]
MLRKSYFSIALVATFMFSCTKLNEKFQGDLTASQVSATASNASALLANAYNSMRSSFQDNALVFCLTELSTDEMLAPTRAGDWDDNGDWRKLHLHRWDGNHIRLRNTFNSLSGAIFASTDVLRFSPSTQQEAEARFLRAWAMWWMLDLFNQVPYRDPGESVIQEARVRKGAEALAYIISEINAVKNNLPDGPAGLANKDAAKLFLMKIYLNKGVYDNRLNPTFAAADMNQVISLADEIINSNKYAFTANYFDNFAPDNTNIGKENIWTQENVGGITPNANLRARWVTVMHYNQVPAGNNGWTTTTDFYNKFEAADKRRGAAYNSPGGLPNPGNRINVGFLAGQQYNLTTDAPLTDRTGQPLIFINAIKIIETGTNLEVTGVRPNKYPIDYVNDASRLINNDFVYFRLADVLLMKAEAILRGGTATVAGTYGGTPLALVNSVRTLASRGATALAALDLNTLLDERGRELYLECWRRQDMVRFKKYLEPFNEKNYVSEDKYILFAIPIQQLSVNTNLTQNPGY